MCHETNSVEKKSNALQDSSYNCEQLLYEFKKENKKLLSI